LPTHQLAILYLTPSMLRGWRYRALAARHRCRLAAACRSRGAGLSAHRLSGTAGTL